jgi:hypothetical protein
MRSEWTVAGVPVGGNGSVCPCAGLWVLMAFVAVGLLPPAFSLCPHAPPGKKAWWNAKAGAAIMVIISAEANATTKTSSPYSIGTSSPLLCSGGTYAIQLLLDYLMSNQLLRKTLFPRTQVNKDGFSSV